MVEAKENAFKWNHLDYPALLNNRPLLILESRDRNTVENHAMVDALRKVGELQINGKITETGHSFSDHPIVLELAVLEWLAAPPTKW
jgi:hypothetical protein